MKSADELRELYREEYAEGFERSQSRRRIARLLHLMQVSPADHVVDLGCGSGLLVPFLAPRVKEYLGVDFSEEFIRIANRKLSANPLPNVRFICGSVQDVAMQYPGRFAVAFALDFAEHVYDDEWLDILRAARRLLRTGGRFYLHTPNAGFFLERMKAAQFLVRQFPEHVAVRTIEENRRLLEEAGFQIARSCYLPHYNVLKAIHPFTAIPPLRNILSARVFLEAHA
jgi:cyclopropane fatty-acyl-phospholipid synthase-like methyltransferase